MYVDAPFASVVGTPAHVTVIVAGLVELPGAVTDAVAFGGAGGGAEHGACAKTAVLADVKQVNMTRTPKDRAPWAGAKSCIAVLQRVSTVVVVERAKSTSSVCLNKRARGQNRTGGTRSDEMI